MTDSASKNEAMRCNKKRLQALDRGPFDVAIIGGGIYGAMLSLHAASCGLKVIILERRDFGAETTFNSLRILHGGLRYLQSLDFSRSLESVRERRWFMQTFPELVSPLPCLLPLYDQGLRRPLTMRLALGLDRILSMNRNTGLVADQQLPPGKVLDPDATQALFPQVSLAGLSGAALWYDASIPDSQRLLMEVLNWAVVKGAVAVNYLEFVDLLIENNAVRGLVVKDRNSQDRVELVSPVVINATGPWCEGIAEKYDPQYVRCAYPSLAWNVLFDREALSDCALGITQRKPGAQVYFLHPWKGRMLAGTGHASVIGTAHGRVTEQHLASMIGELNDAVPGLSLSTNQIRRVFSGILPVRRPESIQLADRPVIYDHGQKRGPKGLVSVFGVKLGASRSVAEKTIRSILKRYFYADYGAEFRPGDRPPPQRGWRLSAIDLEQLDAEGDARARLVNIIQNEAVVHLDDLALRRTTLWEYPSDLMQKAPALAALFGWDEQTSTVEITRLARALRTLSSSANQDPGEP